MKSSSLLTAAILAIAIGTACSQAQSVPDRVNFQGQLSAADGKPIATNDYDLSFSIYDTDAGGSALWGPQTFRAPVVDGYFNVVLGPQDASGRSILTAFNGDTTYVEIKVGTGSPITPRQRILSAPYALKAKSASLADEATRAATADYALRSQSATNAENGGPVGQIIALWPGAPAPDPNFWLRCDGRAVPPSSRLGQHLSGAGQGLVAPKLDDDRFLMGSDARSGSNGDNKLTLTTDEMPAHSHPMSESGDHAHGLVGTLFDGSTYADRIHLGGTEAKDPGRISSVSTTREGAHTHNLSSSGSGAAFPLINSTVGATTGLRHMRVAYYIKIN